jgi:F0F1-type ATP synthase assembly protein I
MPEDGLPSDAEIADRLNRIKENLYPELEDVDSKLQDILDGTEAPRIPESVHDDAFSKLEAIEKRAASAKVTLDKMKPQSDTITGGLDKKTSVGMGLGFTMAYTIIGTPLAGYAVGLIINKLTGAKGWEIWLVLGGGILGIIWVALVASRNADRM